LIATSRLVSPTFFALQKTVDASTTPKSTTAKSTAADPIQPDLLASPVLPSLARLAHRHRLQSLTKSNTASLSQRFSKETKEPFISFATKQLLSEPLARRRNYHINLKPNNPNHQTSFILDNLNFISFIFFFPISPLQDTENYKQQFPSQTALSFKQFVFQTCFKESKLC
jgi:hypothetical protein